MRPKKPALRSMSSLRRPGRKSLSCTAPFFRPEALARRATSTASFRLVAIGFSQYTCLPARSACASSCGRICVVPASKKTVSSLSASASSRLVPQRTMPFAFARASIFSALRPMRIGSGMTLSPFASATPPCARMAQMDRMRCWFMPMRPVTPCMIRPSRFVAMKLLQKVGIRIGIEGRSADRLSHPAQIAGGKRRAAWAVGYVVERLHGHHATVAVAM